MSLPYGTMVAVGNTSVISVHVYGCCGHVFFGCPCNVKIYGYRLESRLTSQLLALFSLPTTGNSREVGVVRQATANQRGSSRRLSDNMEIARSTCSKDLA